MNESLTSYYKMNNLDNISTQKDKQELRKDLSNNSVRKYNIEQLIRIKEQRVNELKEQIQKDKQIQYTKLRELRRQKQELNDKIEQIQHKNNNLQEYLTIFNTQLKDYYINQVVQLNLIRKQMVKQQKYIDQEIIHNDLFVKMIKNERMLRVDEMLNNYNNLEMFFNNKMVEFQIDQQQYQQFIFEYCSEFREQFSKLENVCKNQQGYTYLNAELFLHIDQIVQIPLNNVYQDILIDFVQRLELDEKKVIQISNLITIHLQIFYQELEIDEMNRPKYEAIINKDISLKEKKHEKMDQIKKLDNEVAIIQSHVNSQSQLDISEYHSNYQNYFQKTLLNKIKKQVKQISEDEQLILEKMQLNDVKKDEQQLLICKLETEIQQYKQKLVVIEKNRKIVVNSNSVYRIDQKYKTVTLQDESNSSIELIKNKSELFVKNFKSYDESATLKNLENGIYGLIGINNNKNYQNGYIHLEDGKLVFQIFNKQVALNLADLIIKVEQESMKFTNHDHIVYMKLDEHFQQEQLGHCLKNLIY